MNTGNDRKTSQHLIFDKMTAFKKQKTVGLCEKI